MNAALAAPAAAEVSDAPLATSPTGAHMQKDSPGWRGSLSLDYRLIDGRTVAHDRHDGPLRVLKALYPQGPHTCEHVLVHPPGGLVGGDELRVEAKLGAGTRVRLTTPGATRFYKSLGPSAVQRVRLQVEADARLEWLPMETIAYAHCRAVNECRISLAPGAQMIGWDLCCLGLPASGDGFEHGEILQHLEIEGMWLERGRVQAQDRVLRQSPLGLDGMPVVAALWCASGTPWSEAQREDLLGAAQSAALTCNSCAPYTRCATAPDGKAEGASTRATTVHAWGVTSPNPNVVVMRALAQQVEPVFETFKRVREAWHQTLWMSPAPSPRLWKL